MKRIFMKESIENLAKIARNTFTRGFIMNILRDAQVVEHMFSNKFFKLFITDVFQALMPDIEETF